MTTKPVEERLLEAETIIAHLEQKFDELNGVVIEQGKTIQRLQTQVKRLAESAERDELERIRDTISKPPHSQI